MPSSMDHVADVANGGFELRRLAKLYTFPEFVKSASGESNLVIPKGTPLNTCADPVNKQFWCHTKAACWLSHLFYYEKQAEFHPKNRAEIEARLEKYAQYHQIAPACDAIKVRYSELHKASEEQLPDNAYAYVWVGENGVKERHMPMRSPMEVKAAAEYLQKHNDRFPFSVRNSVATRILEKAAQLGAGLKDHMIYLERQAGRGVCDPKEVVAAIEKRAMAVPADAGAVRDAKGNVVNSIRLQFQKMAQCIEETPRYALQPDMLVKLAETLEQLDLQNGFQQFYGKGLTRPEEVIFSATFSKVSADLEAHVATTSGKFYEKAAFSKLSLDDVRGLFGEDFANAVKTSLGRIDVEKMAEQVETLPRPEAEMLDSLLSDNGIVPVMHKAAASKLGMEKALMESIAAEYALA